jgi:small subunit ribosomal protein S13
MSFILGTRYAPTKKIRIALTQIFGIGINKANQICDRLGLCETYKVNQLTKSQIDQLIKLFQRNYLIDSELLRIIQNDVKRLIQIGCYRGIRHNEGLPNRGQRTHTNAKTSRKNKILKRKNS